MTTHEILKLVRENMTDPDRWCQLMSHSYGAGCMGLHLVKASGGFSFDELNYLEAGDFLANFISPNYSEQKGFDNKMLLPAQIIGVFNDTHTHAECLALLDDAIEATTPVIRDLPAAIKYIFRPETVAA